MKLITRGNAKIRKGEKLGWQTVGVHLAPSMLSGRNVCSFASKGCIAACLNTAGRGQFTRTQESRIAKTKRFHENPSLFVRDLMHELESEERRANKRGMQLCVRLNLTSDISWESIRFNGTNLMDFFPDTPFYDYTKSPRRMLSYLSGEFPLNYTLTFSRSESNDAHVQTVMERGGNVAAVFGGDLPAEWNGRPVISGDETDLRFLDAKGVVVGLSMKGKAKDDKTGFVIPTVPQISEEQTRLMGGVL